MTADRQLDSLAAFVPTWLLRSLAEDPLRPRENASTETPAATLLADITGFTALAEKLDGEDASGAERLAGILDACFEDLIETVLDHGGDVLRFAGDALLVLFPAASLEDLPRAVHLAAQCAQAAHKTMPRHGLGELRLRLRIGIGAGTVRLSDVGGEQGRWEFLAAGEPLLDMAVAESMAQPGETVLSKAAAAQVDAASETEPLRDGARRVVSVRSLPLPQVQRPIVLPHLERAVRSYVPGSVVRRVDAGQDRWFSEFRDVTILFINLSDPALRVGQRPAELQRAFRAIQTALLRHDGDSSQLVVDDKGVITVAAFGLPMHAHEDDALRAVSVAREVNAELSAQGVAHRIGIASGRVFCGTYGKAYRREAVIVGHTVNLASRLADVAVNGILCDGATARRAGTRARFEALPPIAIKGTQKPVAVLRPVGDLPRETRGARVVARDAERARLDEALAAVMLRGEGLTVLIEGEAGIGKSVLADHFLERAAAAGITGCKAFAQASEESSAYGVWRAVVGRLLGLEALADPVARTSRVRSHLRSHPERADWAPLLNAVLPVSFPETEVVRQMPGTLRGPNTRDLMVQVLQELAEDRPLLIVLDDVNWMDSSSWELAEAARRRMPKLILMLAGRPLGDDPPDVYRRLNAQSGTLRLPLDRMAADDLLALVCRQLQVESLPPEVAKVVCAKAEGHPLFGVELACSLRDSGHIEVDGSDCRLVSEPAAIEALDLPSTVQGILNSRFDRLTPQQQLTLKVASVIGRVFPQEVLEHVHPVEGDRPTLGQQLDALSRRDFTALEIPPPNPAYAFRHVLIQEAAYNLLAFSQRRELHRAVAEHHEQSLAGSESTLLPVLAHHWRCAEQPTKAVDYLDRAGENAFGRGANREAITHIERAQRMAGVPGHADARDQLRASRRSALLGEAHMRLGELGPSRAHLQRALDSIGGTIRKGGVGRKLALARQILRQGLHLVIRRKSRSVAAITLERRSLLSRVAGKLSEHCFYELDVEGALELSLISVNEAESSGDIAPASHAYIVVGFIVGAFRLRRLARRYFVAARQTDDASSLAEADISEGALEFGFARWERARELILRGQERARSVNDRVLLGTALESFGVMSGARNPMAALELHSAQVELARESSNVQHEMWGLLGMAAVRLARREPLEALAKLREIEQHIALADPSTVVRLRCLLPWALLCTGDQPGAVAGVREALQAMRHQPVRNPSDLTALAGLARTCLMLLEEADPATRPDRAAAARAACAALRRFSLQCPMAAARAWRLEGTRERLEGRLPRARRCWSRAIDLARAMDLPFDEAVAHAELAETTPKAVEHHARAEALFAQLAAEASDSTLLYPNQRRRVP